MDKNALKKYAVWARNELIARVMQKAEQYEITEKKTTPRDADSIKGRLLTDAEKHQRKALIENIQADGFEQVMEEVAYTWFNRFTALRFMEVNNYLPSHTRVFTNEAGEFKPQILADAIQLDLEGLDMDKVFELKDANKTEELYKYLLITQCNALSAVLPRMFQKIEHYTELLLPDYLLREGSVIEQMIALIPEEDWTDQVQIIGWLYQYYNTEPKEEVLGDIKSNRKVQKSKIPAATQLFTPDWIVRYMVENSLGRLWVDGHPNTSLKEECKYYLDEAKQDDSVQVHLDSIFKDSEGLKPEDIRCIDPCMGSGHILCYMFDVLVRIYEDYGYTAREAVVNIVEKNLWGLDIDERAVQLSYFAVMMKARQYDRRFLTRGLTPHVYEIKESNPITIDRLDFLGETMPPKEAEEAKHQLLTLIEEFRDAKDYGSLIDVTPANWDQLRKFAKTSDANNQLTLDIYELSGTSELLMELIDIGETLSQTYHVSVTNPPYMGSKGMNAKLLGFIQDNYPEGKSDLYGAFVYKIQKLVQRNGYMGLLTPYVWMYLSSFKKLREDLLDSTQIVSLVQLEYNAFEVATVPVCTYVLRKTNTDYIGRYIQLSSFRGWDNQEPRTLDAIRNFTLDYCYEAKQSNFKIIQDSPVSYWLSNSVYDVFQNADKVIKVGTPKQGLITGDNNTFMRLWFEVGINEIDFNHNSNEESDKTWFPHSKGGAVRRWYGNNDYVVNWKNNGRQIKTFVDEKGKLRSRPQNEASYFHTGITWSDLTISWFSARYVPQGFIFDGCGPTLFLNNDDNIWYMCGYFNSWVFQEFLNITCQGMHYSNGIIGQLPVIIDDGERKEKIEKLVKECIQISKSDWDEQERSWDFKKNVLIEPVSFVEDAVNHYIQKKEESIEHLRANEKAIDDLFAEIFGMQDVKPSKGICEPTLVKKSERELIISLISYAVGCMFGRYSLDREGIQFAGGKWDSSKYSLYKADKDNIIPISDDEYFEDDIVNRFISFIAQAYGDKNLEENLKYIASVLGGKGSPREILRTYFLNDFYSDHCNTFSVPGSGKRPIYWLFDSGKKNGFKCLMYVHRYQPDTIARIRTDYVHEQQARYRTAIADYQQRIGSAVSSDRMRLNKKLEIVQAQSEELRKYEEKIHHLADQMIPLDLNEGFKKNYEVLKDVLSKVK